MQLTSTQKLILAISIALLGICCLLFQNQQQHTFKEQSSPYIFQIDTISLFPKKVMPNRLAQFIQYLNQHEIPVQSNFELLLLFSNPIARKHISHQLQIDSKFLLFHADLADLMQTGMTELDAQILHFSQRNYQNPFTGRTMNIQLLAEADAESILEDMGGWMAGNENLILHNYCLSIEEIETWIIQAKTRKFKIFAQTS